MINSILLVLTLTWTIFWVFVNLVKIIRGIPLPVLNVVFMLIGDVLLILHLIGIW